MRWWSPDIQLWVPLSYCGWCWGTSVFLFHKDCCVFQPYLSLDCCTVLSGKIFLQFLLLWRISLFCPLFFHSLWSDLFYNVDVSTFSWVLTLFDTLFSTVFVHRVVITVLALIVFKESEMLQITFVEKIKIRLFFSVTLPQNSNRLWDSVDKRDIAGQATDHNITGRMRFSTLDN